MQEQGEVEGENVTEEREEKEGRRGDGEGLRYRGKGEEADDIRKHHEESDVSKLQEGSERAKGKGDAPLEVGSLVR